jgi:hypothetical protein
MGFADQPAVAGGMEMEASAGHSIGDIKVELSPGMTLLRFTGWLATAVMAAAVLGMLVTAVL